MQADVTVQIKSTQNIQDISDEDIAAGSDDHVSTDESVGDDEMEARKATLKEGEKVYVKRTTRKCPKNSSSQASEKTKTTKPKPPQPKSKPNSHPPHHPKT